MSDTLRDALEKLEAYCADEARQPNPDCALSYADLRGKLNAVLTEHPAEPVGVSDEAVRAAARGMQPTAGNHQVNCPTYMLQPFSECTCGIWANAVFRARAALEAALPLLGTRPQPTLCANCEATTFACTACGARLEEN